MTDLLPEASAVGATGVVEVGATGAELAADVDVAIDASGSPAGVASCIEAVRRGGTVVRLGLLPPEDVPFRGNAVAAREITLTGALRFDTEFDEEFDEAPAAAGRRPARRPSRDGDLSAA